MQRTLPRGIEVDPITIAYMAIGAMEAIQAEGRAPAQIELVHQVIQHAVILDGIAEDQHFALPHAYHVAKPFGFEFAQLLLAKRRATAKEACAIAVRLTSEAL
jgi:hypothetical protein